MKHKVIGTNVTRVDAKEKVTGVAKYTDDIQPDSFYWGAQIGSNVVSGVLKGVHKNPNFDWSDFIYVDASDIPGENEVESVVSDMPLLATEEIRYWGQPIALLAHKDKHILEEGLKNITVEIDENPIYVSTIDESLSLKKEIIPQNVFKKRKIERGDVEFGFKNAKYVFEDVYYTPHQEQMYLEPNAIISWWEGEKIVVKGSMQCPYYVQASIKAVFHKEDKDVEIIQAYVGGAFGGKEDYPSILGAHAALLAMKANEPVKMVYERAQDISITTKRHPSKTTIKMGFDKNYKLTTLQMEFILDGGSYETMSSVILARGMLHAFGPYEIPNVRINGIIIATNTPPNGAFRGFGAPQSFFATESHIDYCALKIGISPFKLREINFVQRGGSFPTGQLLENDVMIREVYDELLKRVNYPILRKEIDDFNSLNSYKKRGFGVATFFHGAGFTGSGEVRLSSIAGIRLDKDGKVAVLVANTEMGQGAHTVLSQIVAEALELPFDMIYMEEVNTQKVPNSGPTVASRTTMIVGEVLRRACVKMHDAIKYNSLDDYLEKVTQYLGDKESESFFQQHLQPPKIKWDDVNYQGDAYGAYAWAIYGVEIEVDLRSFEVTLKNITSVMDIGEVVHPILASGQIEGGIVQSMGYALYENIVFKNGRFWNADFTNYIIPSIVDIPKMDVSFLNNPYSYGPFGAKGIGELPMNGGAPAVNNAIMDALGVHLTKLPLSPEQIMEAYEKL